MEDGERGRQRADIARSSSELPLTQDVGVQGRSERTRPIDSESASGDRAGASSLSRSGCLNPRNRALAPPHLDRYSDAQVRLPDWAAYTRHRFTTRTS